MVDITVFTPTFNREHLLSRLYESLQKQTLYNFMWIVVDDGSTDNTEVLIKNFINETTDFEIKYFKKENGGLHTGYNVAIEHLTTELAVCIDSDDYMPNNAIELITKFWSENGNREYAGIVALDIEPTGKIIGDLLPGIKNVNLIDLYTLKYSKNKYDRKYVVRTDLYKEVAPQPTFYGEKNFNPNYMHLQISEKYDFLVLNEPLCVVDYQNDGMSSGILRQFYNSPNSFEQIRRQYLSFKNTTLKFKFRHSIHYVSSAKLAKKKNIINNAPRKIYALMAYPFGIALSIYIKYKCK